MQYFVLFFFFVGSVRASDCWIDPDTSASHRTTTGAAGNYELVFSDEFNRAGRQFQNGKDKRWTAVDIPDNTNNAIEYYSPDHVSTANGKLRILTEKKSTSGKPYTSAMLQGWNKFCFTGGIMEVSAKVPQGGGYWPALWLFGNLGRAAFRQQRSNDGLWPWSFNECDQDLQNRLGPDHNQRISACDTHNLETDGLNNKQGRGAPEIDLIEAWNSKEVGGTGSAILSLQLAPRLPDYFHPQGTAFPAKSGRGSWYDGISTANGAYINNGWYGPTPGTGCRATCPDALSASAPVPKFDQDYHTYRVEWETGPNGFIEWSIDGKKKFSIPASALKAYSDPTNPSSYVKARQIPEEPMYIIINTAIGSFAGGEGAITHAPGEFFVDYIRVFQRPGKFNTGCDNPQYPTAKYIQLNPQRYGPAADPLGSVSCPNTAPTSAPSQPTSNPTTIAPTGQPTLAPSAQPSASPTAAPSAVPSAPTVSPAPTVVSAAPTTAPSAASSTSPTTASPSSLGTQAPTSAAEQASSHVAEIVGFGIGGLLGLGLLAFFFCRRRRAVLHAQLLDWDDDADVDLDYSDYPAPYTNLEGFRSGSGQGGSFHRNTSLN